MPPKKLLILGGTSDGAELAKRLVSRFGDRLDIMVSYAGVTGQQPDLPCVVRVGGFGGASGLISYIEREEIDFLIDATHPYAEKISQHAYVAAQATSCPILVFMRIPWDETPKDHWITVPDMQAAARMVAEFNRPAFLTIGINELDAFAGLGDVPLLVRMLKEPEQGPDLDCYELVTGRPPFSVEDEKQLMLDKGIKILVSKNSGGDKTFSKIHAARELGIGVIMVDRPPSEPIEHVATFEDAGQWLIAHGM